MTSVETFFRNIYGKAGAFLSGNREVSNRNLAVWTIGAAVLGYLVARAGGEPQEEEE